MFWIGKYLCISQDEQLNDNWMVWKSDWMTQICHLVTFQLTEWQRFILCMICNWHFCHILVERKTPTSMRFWTAKDFIKKAVKTISILQSLLKKNVKTNCVNKIRLFWFSDIYKQTCSYIFLMGAHSFFDNRILYFKPFTKTNI